MEIFSKRRTGTFCVLRGAELKNDFLMVIIYQVKPDSGNRIGLELESWPITDIIPLHEKFLQFDWLRAVEFQLNLKYLHVKITNL